MTFNNLYNYLNKTWFDYYGDGKFRIIINV